MNDRLVGLLLFLPVPLVLWLFTKAPLGIAVSLAVGTALMATHRLYARPWVLARAGRRCLWCARPAVALRMRVREPLGETDWCACSEEHARALAGLLAWASAHAVFLQVAILGTLVLFLLAGFAAGFGWPLAGVTFGDLSALFRLVIAVAVLPLGWRGGSAAGDPRAPLRSPFPLHIQALIGSAAVVWLFRLVGLVWLVVGVRHLLNR